MLSIPVLLTAAVLTTGDPAVPAFSIHLPGEKIGYPGAEYWAEIESPDGTSLWAFAIYTGKEEWAVPLRADTDGVHRLRRVEKRQGNKREDLAFSKDSQTEVEVDVPEPRQPTTKPSAKPAVEAGEFKTFFAAKEPWCINDHTLVQTPEGQWHLFGITHPKPLNWDKDRGLSLAHATADALLQQPWDARPPAVTADWEKYQEFLLWAPHVIRHGNTYYMFVCTGDQATHNYRISLLTSPDLETWIRHKENPLLRDGFDGRDPMVMRDGNDWIIYYTATTMPEGGNHIVASVTSPDLIHWSNRKVVFVHPNAGTFGGPTESPFVVRRGNHHYYLFVCDNDWTDVYYSRNPYHWDYDGKVARIRAHAAEIVRGNGGQWYITHAGWESGPVKIAPLKWNDDQDETPSSVPPGYPDRQPSATRLQWPASAPVNLR